MFSNFSRNTLRHRQTDRRHYHANSRSYCVAVRPAKTRSINEVPTKTVNYIFGSTLYSYGHYWPPTGNRTSASRRAHHRWPWMTLKGHARSFPRSTSRKRIGNRTRVELFGRYFSAWNALQSSDIARSEMYRMPRLKTVFGEQAFSHAGPAVWNSLPSSILASTNTASFCRLLLKAHLLKSSFHTVNLKIYVFRSFYIFWWNFKQITFNLIFYLWFVIFVIIYRE